MPASWADFEGVARELPRLAELGITAVELMPINDFPGRRNWGYDGVLPYAPDAAYGTPDDLKALVDAAHDHGLMIFLDVVYNHFGPDGNYLSLYAPQFFREDRHTPWGPAIDFRRPEVRGFFTDNVLYWLMEYRFDGLRFDAVHAIQDQDWVDEMAATVRATVEPGRHVHLVLEHHNDASHLEQEHRRAVERRRAQRAARPADRRGRRLLPRLCRPAGLEAGALSRAKASSTRASTRTILGEPRGMPSGHLPPTAFVLFLQNHDQIGNRAFGERLTTLAEPAALEAAIAPADAVAADPAAVHGRGDGEPDAIPVLHRSSRGTCRCGARRTAQRVRAASRRSPIRRAASAFPIRTRRRPSLPRFRMRTLRSVPAREALYRRLIDLRASRRSCRVWKGRCALTAEAVGPKAVVARWRLVTARY